MPMLSVTEVDPAGALPGKSGRRGGALGRGSSSEVLPVELVRASTRAAAGCPIGVGSTAHQLSARP